MNLPRFSALFSLGLVFGLATLVCAPRLRAAAPTLARSDQAQIVTELTQLSTHWDEAIVRKDGAAIADNMAADFRNIDGTGDVADKTAFVESLVSPDLTLDPYTVDEFDVRVYGDTGLLSGTIRMTGKYQGKPFVNHFRYIDIYVRREGQWKIVSVQISKIPKKNP